MIDIYLRNNLESYNPYDHTKFISNLAEWIKPNCYLELGLYDGLNFIEVSKMAKKSIGVDINDPKIEIPINGKIFLGKTDEFFSTNVESFDLVFIDADHSFEQSLKDFMNAKDFVVDDGFILLHDTYPLNERFLDQSLCGDSYKTALYIKNELSDEFEVLTLPFHPGLTLVKKMKKNKQVLWI